MPANNATMTANAKPIDYKISYITDGGVFAEGVASPTVYTVVSESFNLPTPTKNSYEFLGWSWNNGEPANTVTIAQGTHEDRIYTANYRPSTYTITLTGCDNATVAYTSKDYNIETEAFDLPVPTKTYYDFVGWILGDGTPVESVTITQGTHENRTYVASWTLKSVLTFNLAEGVSLEIRLCPAGNFIMGSPASPPELGRVGSEWQHPVTITKMFYMGKYEVTQAQYQAIMGVNPSYFTGDLNRPVERVSYLDAKAFCAALNTMFAGNIPDGYTFDLPTEAQWEYACRAGTTTSLNNGHNITTTQRMEYCPYTDEVAWYAYNSGGKTHPVGTKAPNAFGLYDMHSNLFEWVRDWYLWNVTDEIDPEGPETGTERVFKGGCWNDGPDQLRSAYRLKYGESHSSQHIGFRVALVPIKDNH